uniref:Uncharacterized protein n=1 Tax=Chromera velia CCMP2878 TaxID=1169474 RepID=A0A0G4I0P6_9ALVE|eukprot:Cvel_9993.t1-p1 / transcript=Cvel_9993.t1 / gene=Cvel_9993 / organism=Chromera_velia_CCMP2878 / gene_product=hypothetical protein / transcript_product=hypothetical protein / location=Cvel_scaffold591:57180-57887(+) / protein_length=236 / sequence_SO=supercontig / SO=protein_coding / is_pseudo=false
MPSPPPGWQIRFESSSDTPPPFPRLNVAPREGGVFGRPSPLRPSPTFSVPSGADVVEIGSEAGADPWQSDWEDRVEEASAPPFSLLRQNNPLVPSADEIHRAQAKEVMKGALIERRGEMEAVCVSSTTTKKIGISTFWPDPQSENPRDFKLGELDGMVKKGRVLEYFDLADGRIPEGVFSKITHCSQVPRQPRQPAAEGPATGRQEGGIDGAEESGGIPSESEGRPPGSDMAEATD